MEENKHSVLGISSFITGIISGILMFGLLIIAGVMETSSPGGMDEESVGAMIVGLFMILFLLASLIALGLGIGGLFQKDRKKIFSVLGVSVSGIVFLGTIFLTLIGLAMG